MKGRNNEAQERGMESEEDGGEREMRWKGDTGERERAEKEID